MFEVDIPPPTLGLHDARRAIAATQRDLLAGQARAVLAHELAHHLLSHHGYGSQADMDRMEERARRWAAVRLVSLGDLIEALRSSDDIFNVAEDLGVDPELLEIRLRWLSDEEPTAIWPERIDGGER